MMRSVSPCFHIGFIVSATSLAQLGEYKRVASVGHQCQPGCLFRNDSVPREITEPPRERRSEHEGELSLCRGKRVHGSVGYLLNSSAMMGWSWRKR